ncbi:hypothetical protein [Terrabacter sp. Root85]|uniref:hypothetical protein n=1 Tax=Terrabacter sp. Root85 TaxID=1736603 RepID=UPI001F1B0E88|nr:hypothetical protein [Terrabacter sp. Root85]
MTLNEGRPFLRSEARHLSDGQLRRGYRALFHGVYVRHRTPVGDLELAEAALLVAEQGSYVSHHTAARLLGAVAPDHPDVHVTSRRLRVKGAGLTGHRAKAEQQVVLWRGIRMTSPVQTFLDLAHCLTLVDLVVLGDSLVRRRRTTPDELVSATRARRGPYSRLARRAAALVRAGVDSPMETRLRLLIVLAGLPEPEVDHRVHDDGGTLLRRYDLSYLPFRLIIEYDGRQHAESDEQWLSDIGRDEALDDEQIRRLVVVSRDIYSTPANTLARITRAMRRAGMPVPRLRHEWRRHFPSRSGDLALPA